MVWNDFFDVAQDRRERPFRPIPSGQVSRREAALVGAVLLLGGVLFAGLGGLALEHPKHPTWLCGSIALYLVAAIFLYDGWLKRTPLGPLGMGACRFLNVLLGLSASGGLAIRDSTGRDNVGLGVHLAFVVGLYIVGVTWLAQHRSTSEQQETTNWSRSRDACQPVPRTGDSRPCCAGTPSPLFPYLLVALGVVVGLPIQQAIRKPSPERVQAAVKRSLMGLVLLDAVLATALAGSFGLLILLLLGPSLYLNRKRWLYAT